MTQYPATAAGNETDELAGVVVADPYRWLEDSASADVQAWQQAQNELASSHVRGWRGFAAVRALVEQHMVARPPALPSHAGGRWFRQTSTDDAHEVVVADALSGPGSVVFDTRTEAATQPVQLSWIAPSPDGRVLAVGVCADGSEQNQIRLVDVATGALLPAPPQVLMDSWSGGATWLPDASGFYATVLDGAATDLELRIVFHRLADATTVPVHVPWTTARDYRMVTISTCGRRLVAIERAMNPIPVAVAEIDDPASPTWRPFITGTEASLAGQLVGDEYIAVTDVDAPRGRVVAVDLSRPEPEHWRTVVPESESVVRSVTVVAGHLYLTEFVDTYSRVRLCTTQGEPLGDVPLPGRGAVAEAPFPFMGLVRRGHPDEFLFTFSTFTSSTGTYRHTPGSGTVDVIQAPSVSLSDVHVQDDWARSADGTLVPFHIVRASSDAGSRPTLVHGYGGFNAPLLPAYAGPLAAFVAAGGTLVHAHLRGGAELGREWWEAGRLKNKQNGYQDLYAIAEKLIADNVTTPERLAVTGGSNGGLMAGVALTQRPGLWAAAVPRVPLLDLIGACRDPYGRHGVSVELGDVDDPEEVRRLLTFSPYHLVKEGSYPAVFIDAGDTDPRCPPWHARKFAARLQAAQSGTAAILLRVWDNVGHGWSTARSVAVEQNAEWVAFVARHTGLEPGDPRRLPGSRPADAG